MSRNPFSRKKKEAPQPEAEVVVEPEKVEDQPALAVGCESCNNTGLEQGVASYEARVCADCNGSPFEPRKDNQWLSS